jgi:hypothetical protein
MLHIITAKEFMRDVVEPDYADARLNVESIRHAFHATVALFSLRDWVFSEFFGKSGWSYGNDLGAFQRYLERQCPEFAIISDVANAAKHLELDRSRSGQIQGARCVRVSGGSGFLGFGAIGGGPISSAPTIEIEYANDRLPLLWIAEKVLEMWRRLFAANGWG